MKTISSFIWPEVLYIFGANYQNWLSKLVGLFIVHNKASSIFDSELLTGLLVLFLYLYYLLAWARMCAWKVCALACVRMCMCVYASVCLCVGMCRESRGIASLWNWNYRRVWAPLCGCWELNTGPLQEQCIFSPGVSPVPCLPELLRIQWLHQTQNCLPKGFLSIIHHEDECPGKEKKYVTTMCGLRKLTWVRYGMELCNTAQGRIGSWGLTARWPVATLLKTESHCSEGPLSSALGHSAPVALSLTRQQTEFKKDSNME